MPISRRTGGPALFALVLPADAVAHGFAVRYDLPIPLGLYLAGAGATVFLSFVVLAIFARRMPTRDAAPVGGRLLPGAGRYLADRRVAGTLQWASAALFALIVSAALFGDTNPYRNISTTFVWVIWWVGMMFVNTFVGDVWALVNPWSALYAGAARVVRAVAPGARTSLGRAYPGRLGAWPAVVLFLAFAWLELVSGEGEDPRSLGLMIVAYSLVTWVGMFVFGPGTWLARGEAFSAVFSTFARFAPVAFAAGTRVGVRRCIHGIEITSGRSVGCAACFEAAPAKDRALMLRLPGTGLLVRQPVPASLAALVLTLLGTVTFDGFFATPAWTAIYDAFMALPERVPELAGVLNFHLVATAALLLFPLVFAFVFLSCCRLMAVFGGGLTAPVLAGHFVLTLLPIAIAYHFAHYLVYLLLAGQHIIPAVSDPFGFGWNLFGTASFKPDVGLVGAKFAWYTGVIAIVVGHVISVCLAHRTAARLFPDRTRMLWSQLPMLALMVAYTMVSLWIIAQPAVQ